VKRLVPILAFLVFLSLAAIAVLGYLGYRRIRVAEARVDALSVQVNDASKLAEEQAAAVSAASLRANEAAARAEQAALGRQQAEVQRQQADAQRQAAESSRDQAITAAQQASQQAAQARDEMQRMRMQREQELDQMQEALNKVVETHRTPNGMVMVLPESTFRFPFDSAELSQKNRELLSRIAGILLVSKGYGLSVFGYTDDTGSAEYNQKLSVRRADAVRDYLVQSGINPSIINVKGYGKTSPLVPDTNAEARAKNRRVEIALTDSSLKFIGVAPDSSPNH
jgi:outer membrane protein OmpA-like peptidoglycan-associated protein